MTGKFMVTRGGGCGGGNKPSKAENQEKQQLSQSLLDFILSALKKSMVSTCRVDNQDQDVISPVHHRMEIGWPTNVQHLTHVTFDTFHGFLGLPVEIPCKAPTFKSGLMTQRCNSVPTILLLMQERLYALGGLKAEGIFRINPENSKEEYVRDQLNRGVVPENIDVHRLAGLIKAWFRELPSGVLDGLSPEQVLQCSTEDEIVELVKQLKPTEGCLLDWAIDLMADVVEQEESNKMNARNIAMVFAPNMTQMSDPLTALMHAVQVTNLLKTLIMKKLRERNETATRSSLLSSHFTDRQRTEKYYAQHEMDTSCESTGPASDDEEHDCSSEDRDEIESLSEVEECCFLRQLDGNENAKDGFRKQLERILCRDNASPRNGSNGSFSDSRVGSSCISTSDDEESRLSSIAFRARDGCKKRNRCLSDDQYLTSNLLLKWC
ncbi:hypothetical protein DH2020_046139 [Rehmannia glutinosa]|uniref:Rho GTPase-activating protein n=1 Tax=Rehmannia glutinosa TaxID=99300 RepID=A0ABR0UC26_REHGL